MAVALDVTKTRDKAAALKFLRKAMMHYGSPEVVVTDKYPSSRAATTEIGNERRQETGRHRNNRAENSHLPIRRRERAVSRFRRMRSLQKFASPIPPCAITSISEGHPYSRTNFKARQDAALLECGSL